MRISVGARRVRELMSMLSVEFGEFEWVFANILKQDASGEFVGWGAEFLAGNE